MWGGLQCVCMCICVSAALACVIRNTTSGNPLRRPELICAGGGQERVIGRVGGCVCVCGGGGGCSTHRVAPCRTGRSPRECVLKSAEEEIRDRHAFLCVFPCRALSMCSCKHTYTAYAASVPTPPPTHLRLHTHAPTPPHTRTHTSTHAPTPPHTHAPPHTHLLQVCLSLLGTWQGPSWDPAISSVLQVGEGRVCGRASVFASPGAFLITQNIVGNRATPPRLSAVYHFLNLS